QEADQLAKLEHDDAEFWLSSVEPFEDAKLLVARDAAGPVENGRAPAACPSSRITPTEEALHRRSRRVNGGVRHDSLGHASGRQAASMSTFPALEERIIRPHEKAQTKEKALKALLTFFDNSGLLPTLTATIHAGNSRMRACLATAHAEFVVGPQGRELRDPSACPSPSLGSTVLLKARNQRVHPLSHLHRRNNGGLQGLTPREAGDCPEQIVTRFRSDETRKKVAEGSILNSAKEGLVT
ncbi:hypothetical protein HPB47_017369, partial [Ixodes persulcatus]